MSQPDPTHGADLDTQAVAALNKALTPSPLKAGLKAKKIPIRTCVACREERPKRELVRVVRTTAGEVALDPSGKVNGRGAYLCPRLDCLKLAIKRKALHRALGDDLPEESLAALETAMAQLQPLE
jgi:hypothetical protein